MTAEVVLFWILSVVAIGAGIAMVTMRNVVHGALMLVLNFFAIAGLFLVLGSSFLAIVQIIVYAGAIMVLFLFVIMLLGVDRDDLLVARDRWQRIGAWTLALVLVGALSVTFVGPYTSDASRCGPTQGQVAAEPGAVPCAGLDEAVAAADDSSVRFAAEHLFGRHIFAFELVAFLLIVAIVGALVMGGREDEPIQAGHPARGSDVGPATATTVPTRSDRDRVLDGGGA